MEIKPEDELSNIVLFPVKEDDQKSRQQGRNADDQRDVGNQRQSQRHVFRHEIQRAAAETRARQPAFIRHRIG